MPQMGGGNRNDLHLDSQDSTPQNSLQNYKKLDYDSLGDDEKQEKYIFHILSDKVSQDSRQKLSNLAKDLSQIYPCEIEIHICDDSIFQGTAKFKGNYLTWFRIFVADFLPSNVRVCLYLDTDMFVFRDLRELFSLDLSDKYAGVVRWYCGMAGLFAKNRKDKDFYFDDFYFNAGFLLFNLDEWRKQDLKNKVLDFASRYQVSAPDQDALNGIIRKENALILPYEYNIIISYYSPNVKDYLMYAGGGYIPLFEYTNAELDFAFANPIIWHFVGTQIWKGEYVAIDNNDKPLGLCWWKIAWETPYFSDELKTIFATKRDNYLVCKEFGLYLANLINKCSKSFVGNLKMPFVVWNAFKIFDLNKDYALDSRESNDKSCESLDRKVAFELVSVAVRMYCRKSKFERIIKMASLPFRIYRAKRRCKKGNFKAQKGSKICNLYAK